MGRTSGLEKDIVDEARGSEETCYQVSVLGEYLGWVLEIRKRTDFRILHAKLGHLCEHPLAGRLESFRRGFPFRKLALHCLERTVDHERAGAVFRRKIAVTRAECEAVGFADCRDRHHRYGYA